MNEKKEPSIQTKMPENLVIYDPDTPLYDRLCLCIFMRELLDEAEKASEDIKPEARE